MLYLRTTAKFHPAEHEAFTGANDWCTDDSIYGASYIFYAWFIYILTYKCH